MGRFSGCARNDQWQSGAEFEKFQRTLVDDFLQWQADIVNEYEKGTDLLEE